MRSLYRNSSTDQISLRATRQHYAGLLPKLFGKLPMAADRFEVNPKTKYLEFGLNGPPALTSIGETLDPGSVAGVRTRG